MRGAKFSEGARFLRVTIFFCKRVISMAAIVINSSYHYVYSNYHYVYVYSSRIFDTKKSWPYLAIKPSNVILVGRPIVNVLCTFLAVQFL